MSKEAKNRVRVLGIVLVLVAIWILTTMVWKCVRPVILPSPVDLKNSFIKLWPSIPAAVSASLQITMCGLGIGLIVGILLGLLMAYSATFMQTFGPFMEATRPIPTFALIPLFLLWFGIGRLPQILLIALGVSAILGVQTYEAIRNMPIVYVRAAFNLGGDKKYVFRTVVVPYIIPHLVGAIRVAAATSWGLDVAAEFMGVQVGLGYTMIVQQMYLNTAGVLIIVIIYSVLAIALDKIIAAVERKVTHWTDREKLSFEGM